MLQPNMAEPVELRADLADLAAEHLIVRDDLVGSGRRQRWAARESSG